MTWTRNIYICSQLHTILVASTCLIASFSTKYSNIDPFKAFLPPALLTITAAISATVLLVTLASLLITLPQFYNFVYRFHVLWGLQILFDSVISIIFLLVLINGTGSTTSNNFLQTRVDGFAEELPSLAFANVESFRKVQNRLNCCGIDAGSAFQENGDEILTGDECTSTINLEGNETTPLEIIQNIRATANGTLSTALALLSEHPQLSERDFFCLSPLETVISVLIEIFVYILAIITFVQIIAFVCSLRLVAMTVEEVKNDEEVVDSEITEPADYVVVKVTVKPKSIRGARFGSMGSDHNFNSGGEQGVYESNRTLPTEQEVEIEHGDSIISDLEEGRDPKRESRLHWVANAPLASELESEAREVKAILSGETEAPIKEQNRNNSATFI